MELEITKQKFGSITGKSKGVQEMTRKVENLCCPFILFFNNILKITMNSQKKKKKSLQERHTCPEVCYSEILATLLPRSCAIPTQSLAQSQS